MYNMDTNISLSSLATSRKMTLFVLVFDTS